MLFFVKTGVKIWGADFGKKTMMGSFESKNFLQSIVSVIIHDGFAAGVVGFFGIQKKLSEFMSRDIF